MTMPQRQRADHRRKARTGDELPQQRIDADRAPTGAVGAGDSGGSALVAHTLSTSDSFPGTARTADPVPGRQTILRRWLARFQANRLAKALAWDALAVLFAVADVWVLFPHKAQTYNIVLSFVACSAMLIRRKWPFIALLVALPGFLAGWATVAAMIALGTLAAKRRHHWLTWVGTGLVFAAAFIEWPIPDFLEHTWQDHAWWAIRATIYTAMPLAIGLLFSTRQELTARIAELAASRSREIRLQEQTVRSAERARLAREMHDVVSHQVTLIAMQAGALQVSAHDDETRKAATTIRELSTRTLEELRGLVGVLRSGISEDDEAPGLAELAALTRDFDIKITVAMESVPENVPASISHAAYRTVQEALTNVRKHAVGAGAAVRVIGQQDGLLVEVRNGRPHKLSSGLPSGGHGLRGLRERTGLLGGTFHAGPTPEGGFRVEATYPLELAQ